MSLLVCLDDVPQVLDNAHRVYDQGGDVLSEHSQVVSSIVLIISLGLGQSGLINEGILNAVLIQS